MTSASPTALPTGTVTFLFTDVEGSTRLLESLGERFTGVLERHHAILREAIAWGEGTEVGTEGDAFFAVFPSAPKAVAAASRAQQSLAAEPWPEDARVRVRMGLHTGEGTLGGDSYVGLDVHRAARVAAAGHGGQVLLSGSTQALAVGNLPAGADLADLGQHRLKDLSRAEHLWQLTIEGLPTDFGPPRTLNATPNNLPLQLTSFLGRRQEVADITELLSGHRLVTLTGPGGAGKTRLALQVAAEATDSHSDGVYFVALEPITNPDLVLPTIAQSVGLAEPGAASVQRVAEHLGDRAFLLVLDNFEQVDAAAPMVGELLGLAPRTTILATSRSPLRVYGEREYPVPPLGLPDPRHLPELEQFTQFESVALFVERAIAVRPGFVVDNANAPAIAEICVRLDGLPLAIELAAARVRVLTPQAILDRLSDRLGLLSGGARDLPERQQTLRGAIAWSYDLLEDADRQAFARLSVFAGGATLEQIEEICFEPAERGAALDVVTSLVDKSLLREEASGDVPRFRMLETIRHFATEQLEASGQRETYRQRHGTAMVAFTERGAAEVMGPEGRDWLDRFELERDNIRAAVAWSVDGSHTEPALRLLASCWRYWQIRGYLTEARAYADRIMAAPDRAQFPVANEAALEAAGGIAYWQGDFDGARVWYGEALDLARARHDDRAEANAIYNMTFTWSWEPGQQAEALRMANEALEVNRRLDDQLGIGRSLWARSSALYFFGKHDAAAEDADEALAIFRAADDRFMIAWTRYMQSLIYLNRGDQTSLHLALTEALDIFRQTDDVSGYVLVFDAFAAAAHAAGDDYRSARFAGFAAATEKLAGGGLGALNRQYANFYPDQLIAADPTFAAGYAEGQQMDLDRAVQLAR
jgi:predicted ATPase/class 3 adenylate cyclase